MTDVVIIPLPGIGTLCLSSEAFAQALEAGRAVAPPALGMSAVSEPREPLLDSRGIAGILGVHDTTVEGMAARKEIPSIRVGRVLRFELQAVLEALRIRHADNRSSTQVQRLDRVKEKPGHNRRTTPGSNQVSAGGRPQGARQ